SWKNDYFFRPDVVVRSDRNENGTRGPGRRGEGYIMRIRSCYMPIQFLPLNIQDSDALNGEFGPGLDGDILTGRIWEDFDLAGHGVGAHRHQFVEPDRNLYEARPATIGRFSGNNNGLRFKIGIVFILNNSGQDIIVGPFLSRSEGYA